MKWILIGIALVVASVAIGFFIVNAWNDFQITRRRRKK